MRWASTLVILLLVFAVIPIYPAYASGLTVVQNDGNAPATCNPNCNITYVSNVIAGNLLVFGASTILGPIAVPTDTLGNIWTGTCANYPSGPSACVWYAVTALGGSDTISTSMSSMPATSALVAVELSGYNSNNICFGTEETFSQGTNFNVNSSTSCPGSGKDYVMSTDAIGQGGNFQPGTGFTINPPQVSSIASGEYSSDGSGVSFPTYFQASWAVFIHSSVAWALAGIVVPEGVIVIPCTWFQVQCWWYPTLVFGLYLGIFTIVARKGEASGEGTIYMELSALNAAAAAQTAMGLLTFVVPLLLIVLTGIYAVRFRNR